MGRARTPKAPVSVKVDEYRAYWADDPLLGFFSADPRQVWARHRATNEPVFVEVGSADEIRAYAREHWKCLVPGCDVPVSVRGGARRDHIFHLSSSHHPGGLESAYHLASKAMLAQWAESQLAGQGTAVEEGHIETGETCRRRADVLVTWPDEARTAIEVEYKAFTAKAWRTKHEELAAAGVSCAWLIGHTRFRRLTTPNLVDADTPIPVTLSPLARAIAHHRLPVLVVNPSTRQVGTVVGDPEGSTPPRADRSAWLILADLDECVLDPKWGIVTPAMTRIMAEHPTWEPVVDPAAAHSPVVSTPRAITYDDAWDNAGDGDTGPRDSGWASCELHARLVQRWGQIPPVLGSEHCYSRGIEAEPAHWQACLYEALIHPFAAEGGRSFTTEDCVAELRAVGIAASEESFLRWSALSGFLGALVRCGVLERPTPGRWVPVRVMAADETPRRGLCSVCGGVH